MIKLLAIAASGGLHLFALVVLTVADIGDLPDGRESAVRLVVAVPVATAEAAVEAMGAHPAMPAERSGTQQHASAEPIAKDATPRPLDSVEASESSAQAALADSATSKAMGTLHAVAPSVPAPMLTPVRGPAPAIAHTTSTAAPTNPEAEPAPATDPTPAVDPATNVGHVQSPPSGGPDGASSTGSPAVLLASVEPAYPVDARRAGLEGRVVVMAFIDAAGAVERTVVEESSGVAALDSAAVAAVSSYRFRPEVRNGAAVASTILVPLRFSLTDGGR